ncbi:porin [Parathalassolituus penaei]|uniref:Porin n=1 Tax=Parathalassolituus penaei TaxID=2997323 RepID=A0A9X3EBN5_9GAMM|nr:porin [Parathalassolituus penaei]MCY0963874.1 porin [Parathalassolituus penaei]
MKKSGLLLAMAALSAVPAIADTSATVYGSIRIYASAGDAADADISNDASRIGLKGSLDTALENVKAVYQVEAFVGRDNGTDSNKSQNEGSFGLDGRLAYVGLTGDFGQVTAGQQWSTLYSMVSNVTDLTINSTGETQDFNWRNDSSIAYVSPVMNGLQFGASVLSDADVDSGEDTDHFQLAAKYTAGALTLAVGLDRAADQSLADIQALSAAYTIDTVTLVALAQSYKTDLAGAEASYPYELGASWNFAPDQTVVLTHYNMDNADDDTGFNLELRSGLGKGTTVYTNMELDNVADEDVLAYGVGLKVDF